MPAALADRGWGGAGATDPEPDEFAGDPGSAVDTSNILVRPDLVGSMGALRMWMRPAVEASPLKRPPMGEASGPIPSTIQAGIGMNSAARSYLNTLLSVT